MQNIILRFYGLGYDNINQANVLIYDKNNCLIVNKKTYNNKLNLCLKTNQKYKLIAKSNFGTINTYFYVNNYLNTYSFIFNYALINQNYKRSSIITFLLTDYYYNNLPIERGNLLLWQR